MTIKYECHYCKATFPASESIDAYDKGYKIGFLCPCCGKNIQAGMLANQKLTTEHYKWIVITIFLYIPVLVTRKSDVIVAIFNFELNLNTVLFISWLLYATILLIFKPHLVMARIYLTKPVNKI